MDMKLWTKLIDGHSVWVGMVLILAVSMGSVGCAKKEIKADAKKEAKKTEGTAKKAAVATAAKAGSECDAYAKALCGIAGDKSQTCGSVKSVLKLLPATACAEGLKNTDYSKKQLADLGKNCDKLVAKLCADLGPTTKTCGMVKTRTKSFGPDRCTQMMGNYGQVLAQLKKMEEANKPLTTEKLALINKPNASSFGPKDAKVVIVEFSDFQCPYCTRAAKAAKALKTKYKGKSVRFVFRQFPLSFHKDAHLAGQASLAAAAQGKFWEYHDMMFDNQRALKRPDLEKYATKLKLDLAKFKKDLDGGAYKTKVDGDMALGQKVAVSGTPTMFINGARVSNPTDVAALSKEIDAALAK
jgi:protein-disulfide isomerase